MTNKGKITKRINDYSNYIKQITQILNGLSYRHSLEVLCETISVLVATRNKALADAVVSVIPPEPDEPIVDVSSAFRLLRQIRKVPQKARELSIESFMPFNKNLIRRKLTTVEKDPEIQAFIHSLDRYYTLDVLVMMIRNRFGADRGITKSSLQRYLQKIARMTALAKEEGKS